MHSCGGISIWRGRRLRPRLALAAGVTLTMLSAQSALALESRSFVVGWFSLASYSQDGDCPKGLNPNIGEQYARNLAALGKTPKEIEKLIYEWQEGSGTVPVLMSQRAQINGKAANSYAHPAAVPDPMLHSVEGKYAYGFNLDGKGQADPKAFEDPETNEKGVDNQLFRALGCINQNRGTATHRSSYWTWAWTMMKTSMPAWIVTVAGEDLDKDGPVTISFERALEHVKFNSNGEARADMTYRIDPAHRNHFRGEIKGGVAQITEPGDMRLLMDPLTTPEFVLRATHARLKLREDSLEGIFGGYQPWHHIYFAFAGGGPATEVSVAGDLPGLYHVLRRNADADPDPVTGINQSISAVYRIEAVPAFAVEGAPLPPNLVSQR